MKWIRCSGWPSRSASTRRLKCGTFATPHKREHARPGVVRGGEAARLHRDAGVTLDGEALGDAPLGGRERARRVTGARHQALDDVAAGRRMKNRHARIARAPRVGDDGQRLPVDLDQLERVLGEVAARGDHEGDRLADVADYTGGERRLQARGRADPRALTKPHRDARDRPEIVRRDHREDARDRARRMRRERPRCAHADAASAGSPRAAGPASARRRRTCRVPSGGGSPPCASSERRSRDSPPRARRAPAES